MSGKQRQEATIAVPSKNEGEKKKEKEEEDKKPVEKALPNSVLDPGDDSLSEEDKALKERLGVFVSKLVDKNVEISNKALESLKDEIRSATSSMTSVPKPLKFLAEHYDKIKEVYAAIVDEKRKMLFSDLMSVLAMTMEDPETRQCLKYRLLSGDQSMDSWGAQYVKHLAAEILMEMQDRLAAEEDAEKLDGLINIKEIMAVGEDIVKFYMTHNAEPDACDILMEVENLDLIKKYCEEHNHVRTCEYLRSSASYQPYPEDMHIYRLCFDLYFKFNSFYHALRFALKLDDKKLVYRVMKACRKDKAQLRQNAYLLGWHQYGYDEDEDVSDDEYDVEMKGGDDDDDDDNDDEDDEAEDDLPEINEIISNQPLSESFHKLTEDLDVVDPKDPETDIFKEQLVADVQPNVISAKKSLAITYVNAFVNAGYGKDKFMVSGNNKDADDWIAKNKDRGQMAAVASVGCVMLWDEDAVNRVDRYFESEQNQIRAGAYLAIGLACSGMRSEAGLGYALLHKPASGEGKTKTPLERVAATFGLGMAYAGQENEDVLETLSDLVSTDQSDTLSSIAALSAGFAYVGTCNEEISNLILADLMDRAAETPEKLDDSLYLLNALGIGLLYLQRQEDVETALEAVEVLESMTPKFGKTMKMTLEALAYAGTGNVLKVQQFLEVVGEHFDEEDAKKAEEEKKQDGAAGGAAGTQNAQTTLQRQLAGQQQTGAQAGADDDEKKEEVNDHRYFQSIATLGIAMCAMGEDLGSEMALRMFRHLIQYGNTRVKRAVPLALSLLCVSNPKLEVMDVLSKLSHDADAQVAQGAILGLGIIGAGTNNARIAGMLRALTVYYGKDPDHLYLVRIAQGLVHTGKGLMTIQPFHSDRFLMSKVALCGILTVLFASIDLNETILGHKHYLLYALVMALKPRMLITLDEKLRPLKTSVRVGQALDVVGQAGRPKAITGFQTHDTPVLLGYQDRAELASDEYISSTPVLEGFAILKPNPDAEHKKKNNKSNKKPSA